MSDETEAKLRAALTERAGAVHVADPDGLTHRIRALRHRRRRRLVGGSAVIVTVVAALALVPVISTSSNDHKTTESTRPRPAAHPAVLTSRLVRDTHPAVSPAIVDTLTSANTKTAIDLYHQLAATPGNVFFSPYSISTALSMAAAGARGETLTQMLAVLHDQLPPAELHRATNALNLALLAPRPTGGANGNPLELELANSEWSQTGFHIEPTFLDVLAREYGAALNTVDFARDPSGSTAQVNAWVDSNTKHRIARLFDFLDPATRLVLVNAVHFKASWLRPFDANATRDSPFTTATGSTVSVPFMHGEVTGSSATGDGWVAADLPYLGDASMTVIVPDAGQFTQFERALDATRLAGILGALEPSDVTLALPKLQLKDHADLGSALANLGMTDAFHNADFSGITGNRALTISQVVHEATVTVDEQGTEAAAATGIGFLTSAVRPLTLSVDRPYLFLIRDTKTGSILFLGRVTNPKQTQVEQH
jgi:serine protease inhibitor